MSKEFIPTSEQEEILKIEAGSHLVLAPPGSGKTELLAHRVFNAKNNGFSDTDIICLTFTNRAAKGMKERIEEKYPKNEILIGNVHHFCSKFLFKNKFIPLNTSILDEEESDQLISELKNEYKYSNKVYNPELIKLATYLKQKNLGFPEEILLLPNFSEIPDLSLANRVCEAYSKEKQIYNYLDFDDLLTLTYHHLTKSAKKDILLSQFNWVQVDEVQDLNPLQWAIIDEITAPESLVVLFGDYEQAIFSFMGAKLESLHKLEKTIKSNPQNGIHNLLKNFRSPSYLLDIYIKYAQTHWTPTWKKPPIPNIKQEAPANALCIYEIGGTISNEANYISYSLLPNLLVNDDKTAIIVRYNNSADKISDSLKEIDIPHFKVSGFDIFRRKIVKGIMAFFTVFQNEYERLSWARLFYEFNVIETLKKSREFINELNTKGITVVDILEYNGKSSRLENFFNKFSNQEIIVFDTETTGLEVENNDIIQIAAIKISGGIVKDTFEVYIKTDKDIAASEKIHNISQEYLNNFGVSHEEGLMNFMHFCGQNAVLCAHNISFDFAILQTNLSRFCNISITDYFTQKFDTITIAKLIYPNLASYKLKDLIDFLKIEGVNSHNALDDAKATVSLIIRLKSDYSQNIKDAQFEFLSNQNNQLTFNKFIGRFKKIYTLFITQLELKVSLNQATNQYLDFYKNEFCPKSDDERVQNWIESWNNELKEVDKLLKHIDFYTNKNGTETLRQKIDKYIPEYRMFKESDLYLEKEKVVVSTVYKAKGLEFDNVIVAEATDDVYPNFRSKNREEILEDARAFYVAMTRSKKKLFITSHTRSPWGHLKVQSRFLNCIREYFNERN